MKHYTPEYCSEVASGWLGMRRTTIFLHTLRKKYIGKGEWMTVAEWRIYLADARWHAIDTRRFFEKLGYSYDCNEERFNTALVNAGFTVHDEGGAVAVIFN